MKRRSFLDKDRSVIKFTKRLEPYTVLSASVADSGDNESDNDLSLPQMCGDQQMTTAAEAIAAKEESSETVDSAVEPFHSSPLNKPSTIPFLGSPAKGRTVSVALPASIVANAQVRDPSKHDKLIFF